MPTFNQTQILIPKLKLLLINTVIDKHLIATGYTTIFFHSSQFPLTT